MDKIKIDCPFYSSGLTTIQIFVNVYIFPMASLIGFILNFTCVVVYHKILNQTTNVLYKYLFINSISNSLAMIIELFSPIAFCGPNCKIDKTYFAQFYYLYGLIYSVDVLKTFSSLIEIILTIDRYDKITKRLKYFRKTSFEFNVIVMFLISAVFYIPFILKKKIIPISQPLNELCFNTTERVYVLTKSNFGSTSFAIYFILFQLVISELLILCIMISFNILLLVSYDKHFKFKSSYKFNCPKSSKNTAENENLMQTSLSLIFKRRLNFRLTLMVVFTLTLNLLGNSPIVILYTFSIFYKIDPMLNKNLIALSNLIALFCFTLYIFVFYYFDKLFRKTLNTIFTNCFLK